MIRTRDDIESRELTALAPYAASALKSRGRLFPIVPHPNRTCIQRDRDRIVHATAFRRLEQKTQVFLPHEGDHFRTRLTHTLEVAQIARSLSRSLGLNEDLAEAIALVHDLGHTPFGHAGEDVLDELMTGFGGFNHNAQSLRVVDLLEQRYPEHPGLNLSYEIREGIAKHETTQWQLPAEFATSERPTLEASLVDLADEIAYNAADIDDAVRGGLIEIDDLRDLSIWLSNPNHIGPFDKSVRLSTQSADHKRATLIRWLVDQVATDLLTETSRRIESNQIESLEAVRAASFRIVGYSEEMSVRVIELKQFLRARVYKHPNLQALVGRAKKTIETIFFRLLGRPELMPLRYQEMLLTERRERVVADYIAGMTDRYAESTLQKIGG